MFAAEIQVWGGVAGLPASIARHSLGQLQLGEDIAIGRESKDAGLERGKIEENGLCGWQLTSPAVQRDVHSGSNERAKSY